MKIERWALTAALLGCVGATTAATTDAPSNMEFVVGNDVWKPGRHYRNGTDWMALSCTKTGCTFEPARLSVRREMWQGHYDDGPTSGQKLTFRKVKPSSGNVIAWFLVDSKVGWLVPGPVTTYASTASRFRRPDSEGTLELAVDLPGGSEARLVPLLDRKNSKFILQLRAQGRRQMLGELASCSHEVFLNYLLWAGDLDRDGNPDFLVSFVDEGQVVLYLSGRAGADALVGMGGTSAAPPYDGECDGEGWLLRRE